MTLHIITVANQNKYYFDYLKESIEKNNGTLTVLGFGMEWKGFVWKFKLMKEHLFKLNKNDIVCFIDGFDVVCVNNINNIITKFNDIKNREKCKIITGFDNVPNKFIRLINSIYFSNKVNTTIINSGTYIGTVNDILDIFNELNINNLSDNMDDQVLLNNYYLTHMKDIYIDINAELFLTIGSPLTDLNKFVTIKNNTVYYNNSKPFFIHAAGSGYLDTILKKLNYNLKYDIAKEIKDDYFKKTLKIIKQNSFNFLNQNKYNILFYIIIILYFIQSGEMISKLYLV
jgi:hypothetical protein